MSAKDLYHDACVHALQKDGWIITHDPLRIAVGKTDLLIDLGAERIVAADRNGERIAVKVENLTWPSPLQELYKVVGEYVLCGAVLAKSQPDTDRTLYLAISDEAFEGLSKDDVGKLLLLQSCVHLIVVWTDGDSFTIRRQ